ncbi:hypothetical protein H0H93_012559 [Arthromyces matolae]|nr:hypothetical protein H0H93_012559 [Arthromyces matolae]
MGRDLDRLAAAFELFNTHGIPSMQYEEKRETEVMISVSTVGTLLSSVTATTLQISLGSPATGTLISVVNSFWFASLVLSIGAALNSLLSVIWKRTPYGSRGRRLPIWITLWINVSAPSFLAVSISSFSAGLAIFTFASPNLPLHTRYITVGATAITSIGIVIVMAWIGYERWMGSDVSHYMGQTFGREPSVKARSWMNTNSIVSHSSATGILPHPSIGISLAPLKPPENGSDTIEIDVESQEAPRPALARTAGVLNVLRKAFRPNLHRKDDGFLKSWDVPSMGNVVPKDLDIPTTPSTTLTTAGLIQDIEFSPDGSLMATSR